MFLLRIHLSPVCMISAIVLLSLSTPVKSEMWNCPHAGRVEVYSDRELNPGCRKIEGLRPLILLPAQPMIPQSLAKPEALPPSGADQMPASGRGRAIDPPSEGAISARVLGSSTVRVLNLDTDWTAERFCIDVITTASPDPADFGSPSLVLPLGAGHSVTCHNDLKPMEERILKVGAASDSDAEVACVRWTKSQEQSSLAASLSAEAGNRASFCK